MTTAWHVDETALARWVEGSDGSVAGSSVEQHLLACAECRAKVAPGPVVDQVWARVQDAVQVPRRRAVERFLARAGFSQADARIMAVSPAFRGAWLIGMAALLAFVTAAGAQGTGRGALAFLAVAPLVPALAVALGYDPELDEALESECATPYSRTRLVLLRSAALLLAGLPAFVVASLLLPGAIAFWWLFPAAVCTALVLLLSLWMTPLAAAGAVGVVWLVLVTSVARRGSATDVLADGYLVAYLALGALAALMLAARRGRSAWGTR